MPLNLLINYYILKIYWSQQQCIPVGCVSPTSYRTGVSLTETPLYRDTPDRDLLDRKPPGQRPSQTGTPQTEIHWTESPLDRDPKTQITLDTDHPGHSPLDTDPPGQRLPGQRTSLDRDPLDRVLHGQRAPWTETLPMWTEWHIGVKTLTSRNSLPPPRCKPGDPPG